MFPNFDIKELFRQYLLKAEDSFKRSLKGQEDTKILIRYWGIPAYIFFYFVIDWLINVTNIFIIDLVFSSLAVIFFAWHIYAMFKCKPKKKKLTKEEKEELRKDRAKRLSKSFIRKLTLQESISKWDPITVTIVLDFYFVFLFLSYIV